MAYLDSNGLKTFWAKIKNWANTRFATGVQNTSVDGGVKVDILNGADTTATLASTTIANATTTTNGAMSSTDKSKLDGIAAKAEVNQNAFGKVVVGSTTVAADAKVDTLTLAGSNVTLTPDATNDKVTIGITKANVTAALGYTPPTKDTTYTLPTASADTLGGVKVGTNLSIADGVLSANDKKVDVSVNYAKVICFTGMAKSEISTGTAEYNTDLLMNDAVFARGEEVWIGEGFDNRMYVTGGSVAFQTKGSDGTYSTTSSINATQYAGNAATATTATSASKVANALTLKLNGTSQGAYDGSVAKEINITASSVGAAASSHTHKYAGSSTAGGSATSAVKLDSDAGSSTTPVYFSSGKPVACSGIATQTYVTTAINTAQANAARYQGGITPDSYKALASAEKGYYWVVTTAGTIAGETCEAGDMVFCNTAFSGVASGAQDAAKFDVVQTNITAIPDSEINALS